MSEDKPSAFQNLVTRLGDNRIQTSIFTRNTF
jgi:hypothetical protein